MSLSARPTVIFAALLIAVLFIAGCDGSGTEKSSAGGTSESGQDASAPPADPFSGTFDGILVGTPVKFSITQQGNQVSGQLSSQSDVSNFTATANGNSAQGRLEDPDGIGGDVKLVRDGESLNMELTLKNELTGESQTMNISFKPTGGGSTASSQSSSTAQSGSSDSSGERDPRLVGNWIHTDAAGSGGFSYAIDTHLTLGEDGSYRYGDSKMGAGDASFSSVNESSDAEVGVWRTENKVVYVKLTGQNEWIPLARYAVADGSMMFTYNNGSKRIWNRN